MELWVVHEIQCERVAILWISASQPSKSVWLDSHAIQPATVCTFSCHRARHVHLARHGRKTHAHQMETKVTGTHRDSLPRADALCEVLDIRN